MMNLRRSKCQACAEPGPELRCESCQKRFHYACARYARHNPKDEFVCKACRSAASDGESGEDWTPEPNRTRGRQSTRKAALQARHTINRLETMSDEDAPQRKQPRRVAASLSNRSQDRQQVHRTVANPAPGDMRIRFASSNSDPIMVDADGSETDKSSGVALVKPGTTIAIDEVATGSSSSADAEQVKESKNNRAVVNNDFCEVCQTGGRLLLCDRCPRGFHVRCIERFVELDSLGQCNEWSCPVCQHGVDILRGQPRLKLHESQMQARKAEAMRNSKRHKRAAAARRDLFLLKSMRLIEPFATTTAVTRITRLGASGALPAIEMGTRVQALAHDGSCFQGIVLYQTAPSRFVVVDENTQDEIEVERDCLAPTSTENVVDVDGASETSAGSSLGKANDIGNFLKYTHKPIVAEGVYN